MTYFTYRLYQQTSDGTWKSATAPYDNRVAAEKQYYKLLANDIDDETKQVAIVMLLDSDGHQIMMKRFEQATEEETEETTEETAE